MLHIHTCSELKIRQHCQYLFKQSRLSEQPHEFKMRDKSLFCQRKHVNRQAVSCPIIRLAHCASEGTGIQAARGADLFHGGHAVGGGLVCQVQSASDDSHLIMRQVAPQPLLQAMGVHKRLQLRSPEQRLHKTTFRAELVLRNEQFFSYHNTTRSFNLSLSL